MLWKCAADAAACPACPGGRGADAMGAPQPSKHAEQEDAPEEGNNKKPESDHVPFLSRCGRYASKKYEEGPQ